MLPQIPRDRLERAGLVVGHWPTYYSLEYHLREVIHRLDIDLVVDVGAFRGDYATALRRVGYPGDIVSFEPVSSSFAFLSAAAARDPEWTVVRSALGDSSGEIEMHVFDEKPDLNSTLRPTQYGRRHFGLGNGRPEQVPIQTLDAALSDLGIDTRSRSALVKVDTQGLDLQVLGAAPTTTQRAAAIQVEVPVLASYEGVGGLPAALDRLLAYGLEISGMFPVGRDADGLRVVEFDCVLVRRR
jgi:FkbM family methyltransferase